MKPISENLLEEMISDPLFDSDPYPTLLLLRENNPVHWSETLGGWIVTGYNDVMTIFKDCESFGNAGRLGQASNHLAQSERDQLQAFQSHYRSIGLLHSDAPEHTRLRSLVIKAFNPSAIRAMQERIQEIVDVILYKAESQGGMEVISDLAWGLPSTVLTDLMGAPPESRALFRKWADDLLAFQGSNKPSVEILLKSQQALVESKKYLLEMISERRKNPGEDLLSSLVIAESEGDRLSEEELLNTCVTLLAAGQETTTALIGNLLMLLLTQPMLLDEVRADRSLIPTTIEEVVRYESPIPRQPRVVRKETLLRGKKLKPGEIVFQMLNGANRDPEVFSDPSVFDIHRQPNRHIGFGLGAHYCVGAPLSRIEATIVLESLLNRFDSIQLVSQKIKWNVKKRNSRVLEELEISFR
jgi:cytochrome P450